MRQRSPDAFKNRWVLAYYTTNCFVSFAIGATRKTRSTRGAHHLYANRIKHTPRTNVSPSVECVSQAASLPQAPLPHPMWNLKSINTSCWESRPRHLGEHRMRSLSEPRLLGLKNVLTHPTLCRFLLEHCRSYEYLTCFAGARVLLDVCAMCLLHFRRILTSRC